MGLAWKRCISVIAVSSAAMVSAAACGDDEGGGSGTTATSSASPTSSGGSASSSSSSGTSTSRGAPDSGVDAAVLPPNITTDPPGSGPYKVYPVGVTLTPTTPGAAIHYSLDYSRGGPPPMRVYTVPFQVYSSATLTAIQVVEGYPPSSPVVFEIDITPGGIIEPPTVEPPGGERADTHTVAIFSLVHKDPTYCYTLDGSAPTCKDGVCGTSSTVYSAPISVTQTGTTFRALACKPNLPSSAIQTEIYTLRAADALPSRAPPGNLGASSDVTLASETPGAIIHYTTDGTPVSCTDGTTYAGGALNLATKTKLRTIACRAGFEPSIARSFVYGITTPAPIFVTGPDRAQLAGDPTQVDAPSDTVFAENVRLLIPDERSAAGATVDTRNGTRRPTDVDCFTTDGTEPACSVDSPSCVKGTRYVPPPNITTASVGVTTDDNQPIVFSFVQLKRGESHVYPRVIKVVRCRQDIGGAVVTSAIASYTYRLKVGPLSASYVTRDSSFAVVALASKEDEATAGSVSTGSGVRTEFVGGSAGGEDRGLDAVATGYRSTQPGAISSRVAGSEPFRSDEEKICYTLDGTTPVCTQIMIEPWFNDDSVACAGSSIDNDVTPIGSSTFGAANTSIAGGAPATAGAPQRTLPFTLRAIGCKLRFENSDERQIVFGN